jgi:hypothetical protein
MPHRSLFSAGSGGAAPLFQETSLKEQTLVCCGGHDDGLPSTDPSARTERREEQMPTFRLTRADDVFDLDSSPGSEDLTPGSRVFALAGDDRIIVGSPVGNTPRQVLLSGGSGDDTVVGTLTGSSTLRGGEGDDVVGVNDSGDNLLFGGPGNDTVASGFAGTNSLFGGAGDDLLFSFATSVAPHGEALAGNTLRGGHGLDTFRMEASAIMFVEDGCRGGTDVISEGDTVFGQIDVILDYRPRETIDLLGSPSAVDEVDVGDMLTGFRAVELEPEHYAVLRGELLSDGRFGVADCGPDLLVLYRGPGESVPFDVAAVAVVGVSDPDLLLIG